MNAKLSRRNQILAEKAERERRTCREWLLTIMRASQDKTRTKTNLRAEAIARFNVSKNAFDQAWIAAIEETGNHAWYEPLRKAARPPRPGRLN